MNFSETNTVREIVVSLPASTRLFEGLGIDYCCGGQRPLSEACERANVAVSEVLRSLAEIAAANPEGTERDWQRESLAALTNYIVEKHHVFTKNELPRLERLLNKVCGVHGQNHPELLRLRELFGGLQHELGTHLLKEEQVLFPYIERLEEAATSGHRVQPPFFGTVRNPVRMMMMEHERAGETLEQMRALTQGYTAPADACISYRTLYDALAAFAADLHQHIHLENNILFPRAEALERDSEPTWQGDFAPSTEHRCFGH